MSAADDEEPTGSDSDKNATNEGFGAGFFENEDEQQDESNVASLDRDFAKAIKKLKEEFPGEIGRRRAANALYPLIERNTVNRFFQFGINHEYQSIQKRRLIWYFDNGPEKFIYRRVADRLSSDPNQRKLLINKYEGDYKYFRYYAPTNNPKSLRYVSGTIKIFGEDKLPRFDHWSHNYDINLPPEHSGYIFQASSHLFFVGTGNNIDVLRLGISEIPKRRTDWMAGLIISLRSDWPHDPFAARFLMVNAKNNELISALSNKDKDPSTHSRTLGESLFFEKTQGSYAYYMLAKHTDQKVKS